MGSSPTAPTMDLQEIYNLPKCGGVYCIKNIITNDCFIGKATKLQKKFKVHWKFYNVCNSLALYKAIREYGIENFKIIILDTFNHSLDWRVQSELDKLEKKYIEQYKPKYNEIYDIPNTEIRAKNIEDNIIISAKSVLELYNLTHIPIYCINKCLTKEWVVANKVWVFAGIGEDLPEYSKQWELEELRIEQLNRVSNKEDILEYLKCNPYCTYGEISQNYNLSKKDFYSYKNELFI